MLVTDLVDDDSDSGDADNNGDNGYADNNGDDGDDGHVGDDCDDDKDGKVGEAFLRCHDQLNSLVQLLASLPSLLARAA